VSEATEKFEEAAKIIQKNKLDIFSPGGNTLDFIEKIEVRLGVHFPTSYRDFLREYGILEVEAEEFYGEFDYEGFASSIPSIVFATEKLRAIGELSDQDVMVKSTGYGPNVIIDCSIRDIDDECPVLQQEVIFDENQQGPTLKRKKIANSFGHFFLDEIIRISTENNTDKSFFVV
jgi:hypothetical protein